MSSSARTLMVLGGVLVAALGAGMWALFGEAPENTETVSADPEPVAADKETKPETATGGARRGSKQTAATIVGEIRRTKGRVPVADQEVQILSERGQPITARTDAAGAFAVTGVPPGGPYELRVAAPKCGTIRLPGIALDRNERRDVGTLWLDPAVSVTVEVRAWSSEPVEGAVVEAFVVAQADNFDWSKAYAQMSQAPVSVAKLTTDATGNAVFPELATGRYTFVATKAGFARTGRPNVSLRSDVPVAPVKIFLGTGHPLSGRVLSSTKTPVAGALVLAGLGNGWDFSASALRERATTDAEGRYAFTTLDAGDVTLFVGRDGGLPAPVATVKIPNVSVFDVILKGTGTVTGVVTEKDGGKPIDAATVRATTWSGFGSTVSEATSDAEGRFSLTVTEGTIGQVSAEKAGWVSADDPSRPRPQLVVREGETQTRDLAMKPGSKVSGLVQGPDGPLAGAKVWVYAGSQFGGFSQKNGVTDADGRYEILAVPPGKAVVMATFAGHYVKDLPDNYWAILQQPGASPFKIDVPDGGAATMDLTLVKGAVVEGRVEGPEGPLAGVRVSPPTDFEAGMITGADGAFRVEGVKPGPTVSLYALREGYSLSSANKPFAVTADQPTTGIVLRMTRAGTVRGTVTVGDGSPLRDARVSLGAFQDQSDGMFRSWNMGGAGNAGPAYPVRPDGSYEIPFAGTSTGKFRVSVTALDRPAVSSEPVPVVEGQSEYVVNLVVDGGRDLTGRVVAKSGGAPVPFAQVTLRQRGGRESRGMMMMNDGGQGQVVWAVTDADGNFAVTHLAATSYTVSASATGYVTRSAVADLAAASTVTVEIEPELTIEGVVMYADGTLLEGANVSAMRDDASSPNRGPGEGASAFNVSGAGGRFRLTGLTSGSYKLTVSQDWQGSLNIRSKTSDPIAAGSTGVKLAVQAGAVIAGRVLDPQKKGVPSTMVSANPEAVDGKRPQGAEQRNVRTRDDGTFSIGGLLDGATYTVSVQLQADWGPQATTTYKAPSRPGVAAGTSNLEIVLEEGLSITGTLADGDGKPLAGVMITCSAKTADGRSSRNVRQAMTDASGGFVLGGLDDGECDITLQEWGPAQGLVIENGEKIAAGSRDVRLVASKGLTISGVVVDEGGAPLRGAGLTAMPTAGGRARSASTNETGAFEITGLAAGVSYSVTATIRTRPSARAADVNPGVSGLRLTLPRGLETAGRAFDSDGSPLRGAQVIATLQGDGSQRQQTQTDGEGNFRLQGLLDAVYEVQCFVQMNRNGSVSTAIRKCGTLKGGETGVEVRVPAESK